MENGIRFDKVFDEQFIAKVHAKFKEHIKERKDKVYFKDILKNEIITPSDFLSIIGKFEELNIQMNESQVAEFLEVNCYVVIFPELFKSGHEFTQTEKTFLAGYALFEDCQNDKNYPYDCIDQQVKEMAELSIEFIKTSFDWTLEGMVKIYDDEGMGKK